MSTNDVPEFNPVNKDVLANGCWAEHEDGSLIFVKSVENSNVIYEIYNTDQDPVVYCQDAMREEAFKKQFSWSAGDNKLKDKWTWHDKTLFPWDRVTLGIHNSTGMKTLQRPLLQQTMDQVRVLRIVEYTGPREDVEKTSINVYSWN